MKRIKILLLGLIIIQSQLSFSQCSVNAGEDQAVCGTTIALNALVDAGDYDITWSTTSSDVGFSDINSPTSELELSGNYLVDNTYSCELTWTTTNSAGITCSDLVSVTFKQTPTCYFMVSSPTCTGSFVNVSYLNNNDPEMSCPNLSDWTIDEGLVMQETEDPCVIQVTSSNNSEPMVNYPIALQVEQNGCVSGVCEDYVTVFSDLSEGCCENPIANAGEDVTVCGLDYILNASIPEGGNHGQWMVISGPWVTFLPLSTQGTSTEPGDPNAHIVVDGPGQLELTWIEWNGECSDDDEVSITFEDQPEITFGEANSYGTCDLSTTLETTTDYTGEISYEWVNSYGSTATFSDLTVASPSVTSTEYLDYTFQCIVSYGTTCSETHDIEVSFIENPISESEYAVCGNIDTLNANTVNGGYWSISNMPEGANVFAFFTNHNTGETDINDPSAVITVNGYGVWEFTWHENNVVCESPVNITFIEGPNIYTLPQDPSCSDSVLTSVDIIGYDDGLWFWTVDPNWGLINEVPVSFDPDVANTWVRKEFGNEAFGDSGYVTVPMIVRLIYNGCVSYVTDSVSFFQRPEPFIGNDTMVCGNEIEFNVIPTLPENISDQQWYGLGNGGIYSAVPFDSYNSTITANYGDSINVVFSEENFLGNNGLGCISYDSILVEFNEPAVLNAGIDTTICGYEYTLNAEMESESYFGYWGYVSGPNSSFDNEGDQGNPTEAGNPNADITSLNPGMLVLAWQSSPGECPAEDIVAINFLDPSYCNLLFSESNLDMPTSETANDGAIDLSVIGGNAPYVYSWSNVSEDNSENEDQDLLVEGMYTLTLTDANMQEHIKHHYLLANFDSSLLDNPIGTLVASIDTCAFFDWEEGVIYNYVVVEDEVIVTWQFGDVNHMIFLTAVYPLSGNTTGAYTYELNINCDNQRSVQVAQDVIYIDSDIMTGLNINKLFEGNIYPNPTDGLVNIDAKDVSEMVLTDITGRVIFNKIQTNTNGKSQIDLSNQKSGIYLLHLKTKEGQQVVKLIKE